MVQIYEIVSPPACTHGGQHKPTRLLYLERRQKNSWIANKLSRMLWCLSENQYHCLLRSPATPSYCKNLKNINRNWMDAREHWTCSVHKVVIIHLMFPFRFNDYILMEFVTNKTRIEVYWMQEWKHMCANRSRSPIISYANRSYSFFSFVCPVKTGIYIIGTRVQVNCNSI